MTRCDTEVNLVAQLVSDNSNNNVNWKPKVVSSSAPATPLPAGEQSSEQFHRLTFSKASQTPSTANTTLPSVPCDNDTVCLNQAKCETLCRSGTMPDLTVHSINLSIRGNLQDSFPSSPGHRSGLNVSFRKSAPQPTLDVPSDSATMDRHPIRHQVPDDQQDDVDQNLANELISELRQFGDDLDCKLSIKAKSCALKTFIVMAMPDAIKEKMTMRNFLDWSIRLWEISRF